METLFVAKDVRLRRRDETLARAAWRNAPAPGWWPLCLAGEHRTMRRNRSAQVGTMSVRVFDDIGSSRRRAGTSAAEASWRGQDSVRAPHRPDRSPAAHRPGY